MKFLESGADVSVRNVEMIHLGIDEVDFQLAQPMRKSSTAYSLPDQEE
jgi:hypothetical protein